MDIQTRKKKLEMMKMDANIMDAEIRIEERKAEIKRIEDQIETYKVRKEELAVEVGE